MTAVASPSHSEAAGRTTGLGVRVVVFIGTILVIITLAVLPLLTPWFIHAALDAAGAAERLGVAEAVAHELSDRSVEGLVVSGSFDFVGPDGGPFYDAAEQGHLGDARMLLWLFLIGALYAGAGAAGRRRIWATISRAGAVTAVVVALLGLLSLVAFGTLFTLFHQVFFPGGNWSFDPQTQRLVQLYPFRFWQIAAAALGLLVLVISTLAWLVGRHRARRPEASS